MKARRSQHWLVAGLVLLAGACLGAELDSSKAELMGRVEDFLMHNFKDVTARKSLAWGDIETASDGNRSIRYEYEARIWDKDTLLMNQVFTFDKAGKFVRFKNADGFPKPKQVKPVDTTTQAGMKELVEDFFGKNFRDVTQREALAWGPVTKAANGNGAIRYTYRAKIWDKETVTNRQVFTFEPNGKFVSVKDFKAE